MLDAAVSLPILGHGCFTEALIEAMGLRCPEWTLVPGAHPRTQLLKRLLRHLVIVGRTNVDNLGLTARIATYPSCSQSNILLARKIRSL